MNPRRWLLPILAALTIATFAADLTGAHTLGWVFCAVAIAVAYCAGSRYQQDIDERDEKRARIGTEGT